MKDEKPKANSLSESELIKVGRRRGERTVLRADESKMKSSLDDAVSSQEEEREAPSYQHIVQNPGATTLQSPGAVDHLERSVSPETFLSVRPQEMYVQVILHVSVHVSVHVSGMLLLLPLLSVT